MFVLKRPPYSYNPMSLHFLGVVVAAAAADFVVGVVVVAVAAVAVALVVHVLHRCRPLYLPEYRGQGDHLRSRHSLHVADFS